jgi:hemoglobin
MSRADGSDSSEKSSDEAEAGGVEAREANARPYGEGDASFQAAGGEQGIARLVDRFYEVMDTRADAAGIRRMHPKDLTVSRDKLARFLCGWLGGPKRFSEKYGPIQIPRAHVRFNVGESERDAWLACMREALESQPLAEDFKAYLMRELFVPAERIRQVVAARKQAERVDLPTGH